MTLLTTFRAKLQFKLVVIVAAAFGIVLVASTAVLMLSVNKLGQTSIQQQLNEEKVIIDQRFAELDRQLLQTAILVSHHSVIVEGLTGRDHTAITNQLQMTATSLNHDLVWVVDPLGSVVSGFSTLGNLQVDTNLRYWLIQRMEPITQITVVDQFPMILAAAPVYGTAQELLGFVVVADVIDSQLLGKLNFVRDHVALVTFADDAAIVGVSANEADGKPHLAAAQVEALRLEGMRWEQVQNGETLHLADIVVRDTPHAVVYQPLVVSGDFAGYTVIAIDENEPYMIQQNVFVISLATVFIVLFLAAFLITVSLRQFVIQPLKTLSHAAHQFGTGQLDTRIQTSSADEIGQLYATFNHMAAQVENRTQELNSLNQALEARVIERTDQIQRQTAWLEAIVCEAQEAIIVTDETGKIRLINDAALRAFGVKESAALGVSLPKLMSQVIRETFTIPALADESRGEIEVNSRFYLYSTTAIRPDKVGINGFVCVLSDVTPLHRLNVLKTQVIRMASHDLRSPLTVLRLNHYLLKKQQDDPNDAQQSILNRMENSISDMQQMVDDMLNLDYIENQAQGMRVAVSIDTLLASGVSLLTPQIQIKNQRVETEIIGDVPLICGDPVRLLEAIRNYLTNAIKYTPNGGTIRACVNADMQQIHVKITDNGIGIDVVDLDHVFESRFRAQTALSTTQEGAGIGLSLVKAIIEEHGGQVWAKSQPGLGSTFGFSLPIDQSCLLDATK